MIKITVGDLSSPGLHMALAKLTGAQVSLKRAYTFKKLNDKVQELLTQYRTEYTDGIVKQYGAFDEKEQLIPEKNGTGGFQLKEGTSPEDFKKVNDEFHTKEITIDREPLTASDLTGITISAAEITALGVFLSEKFDEEEEPASVHKIHG